MPFTLGSPNGGRVHIPQGAGVMPPELVFKWLWLSDSVTMADSEAMLFSPQDLGCVWKWGLPPNCH
jgi:hypothetical protein